MRRTRVAKERFFLRVGKERKLVADWNICHTFEDVNGFATPFFFAKDPDRKGRWVIAEAKTGLRLLQGICELDERTFELVTRAIVSKRDVKERVCGYRRVSRLPDCEEWGG